MENYKSYNSSFPGSKSSSVPDWNRTSAIGFGEMCCVAKRIVARLGISKQLEHMSISLVSFPSLPNKLQTLYTAFCISCSSVVCSLFGKDTHYSKLQTLFTSFCSVCSL